jgi:hypothetical protein
VTSRTHYPLNRLSWLWEVLHDLIRVTVLVILILARHTDDSPLF